MQTRHCAAATALLLTATVGLAATGGAAQASGPHHASDRAAKSLTITIKSTKHGPKLSSAKFRPGNTVFKVVRGNSGGLIQVVRLKKGYSLKEAAADFHAALGRTTDVKAVRRIDKHVVFYGGMETPKKGKIAQWGTDIDKAGTYYVLNFDKNSLATFKAKGKHQKRSLPHADGRINAAPGNVWKPGRHNANKGWMRTTNNAAEPHFVELDHVKKNTTNQDVIDFFSSAAQGPPPFLAADHAETDTGVISPGHTFVWSYHLPKGKFLALCFWPSKVDGMPHALMGMWKLLNLA